MFRPLYAPLCYAFNEISAGRTFVQDRDTGLVVPLSPNYAQLPIADAMMEQAAAGLPVRIAVPKFRRGGVSTFVQVIYDLLASIIPHTKAGTLAHTQEDTTDIFDLAKLSHEERGGGGKVGKRYIAYPGVRSLYSCRTAGSRAVKRGGGLTLLHITELAYLQSVLGLDAAAIVALLNTVPDAPHTMIVIEGTGASPTGEFHRIVMQASRGEGPFKLVFLPWKDDPRNVVTPDPDFEPTKEEAQIGLAHHLSAGQLAWRRRKLAAHRDLPTFKREYPLTVEECFSVSSGLVYGSFSASPVAQGGHVGTLEIGRHWDRYRGIDWGWTREQPFVVLWAAHDPKAPPGLVIDPSCRGNGDEPDLIDEMLSYQYDAKTGKPVDRDNHGPDVLRYLCVTFRLRGLLYIYRSMYVRNGNVLGPAAICRMIHERSGRKIRDDDLVDLSQYTGGGGEEYAGNVADRSQPGLITQFRQWGIVPLIGQPTNVPERCTPEGTTMDSRGEIEDGNAWVQDLVIGGTRFYTPRVSLLAQARRKLSVVYPDGRDRDVHLTREEQAALDECREARMDRVSGRNARL